MQGKQEKKVNAQKQETTQQQTLNIAAQITAGELEDIRGRAYFTWWSETPYPVKRRLKWKPTTEDKKAWGRKVVQLYNCQGDRIVKRQDLLLQSFQFTLKYEWHMWYLKYTEQPINVDNHPKFIL